MIPLIILALLITIDQISKYMALTVLKPILSTEFINGFIKFTYVENRGVAFGLFSDQRWLILILTLGISLGLIWYYFKLPKLKEYIWVRISLCLIFAGAMGNMIDRFFRGYVIDFFEFSFFNFPVFNVADIYVVVGVIILAFCILFVIKDEGKK